MMGPNRKEKISGEEWCTCGSVVEVRGIKIYIYIIGNIIKEEKLREQGLEPKPQSLLQS